MDKKFLKAKDIAQLWGITPPEGKSALHCRFY